MAFLPFYKTFASIYGLTYLQKQFSAEISNIASSVKCIDRKLLMTKTCQNYIATEKMTQECNSPDRSGSVYCHNISLFRKLKSDV